MLDIKRMQPGELTMDQLTRIAEVVKKNAGINLHEGKRELIKARLAKRLRELKLSSYREYLDLLERDKSGGEFLTLLDVLSTNVTHFFREADHFVYLKDHLLKNIESRAKKGNGRRIRMWSAGCSSGEEPYTIAIVLSEAFPDLKGWDAKILATDLSSRILSQAREGVYPAQRLREMPRPYATKYFDKIPGGKEPRFRLKPQLKSLVHFGRLNLMEEWPMKGPFNAIFCRNVMIYFDKETQGRLVRRYHDLLAPGGCLFIGHSESLTGIDHEFRFVKPTVYERKR